MAQRKKIRALGCAPSTMDGSEHIYNNIESLSLPEEYSYVEFMSKILDQGVEPICVPCSISAYINWKINMKEGKTDDYRVNLKQIFNNAGGNSRGMTFKNALSYVRHNGVDTTIGKVKIQEYALVRNVNAIGGYYAFGKELINGNSVFDFDPTKLSVHTRDIGLAGIEVYDILRDEYDIQIEFGDIGNILAYLSIGDRRQELERLVSALAEIRRRYQKDSSGLLSQEYIDPEVVTSPQEAFYAKKHSVPLRESVGCICSEFVMCYPPGIPILAPGERITPEILDYIEYAKLKGCSMTGPEDPDILNLNVLV